MMACGVLPGPTDESKVLQQKMERRRPKMMEATYTDRPPGVLEAFDQEFGVAGRDAPEGNGRVGTIIGSVSHLWRQSVSESVCGARWHHQNNCMHTCFVFFQVREGREEKRRPAMSKMKKLTLDMIPSLNGELEKKETFLWRRFGFSEMVRVSCWIRAADDELGACG